MGFTALDALKASSVFEALPKETQDLLNRVMLTTKEAMLSPMSSVGDAPEIPKSLRTPRPKKDPQGVGPFRMSPQNPQFGKLSTEDKGKTVNIESDDEEEDLHAFIEEIELEVEMEEDIHPIRAAVKLPKYLPPWKGRVKVPKDLDVVKSTLKTPFRWPGVKHSEHNIINCDEGEGGPFFLWILLRPDVHIVHISFKVCKVP